MNKIRVKQIILPCVLAVVVFTLVCPGHLYAKTKGASLKITKLDSQVVTGELLRVQEDSLLIMTSGSGIIISFSTIDKIVIKRKTRVGAGALIGGILGYVITLNCLGDIDGVEKLYGIIGILPGTILGGIMGGGTYYKTYEIRGKSSSEIENIKKKLEKRARFKG